MVDIRLTYPGWVESVNFEESEHRNAIANPHDDICGFAVRHLTLLDLERLKAANNAFIDGEFPSYKAYASSSSLRLDLCRLVNYLTIHHNPKRRIANEIRHCRIALADPFELYKGVCEYLSRTFIDKLPRTSEDAESDRIVISKWAGSIEYVDILASEYGWTDSHIESMPFRKVMQCVRKIYERRDEKFRAPSISDQVIAEHLRKKNEIASRLTIKN